MKDYTVDVNVIAYRDLSITDPSKSFYDGDLVFHESSCSLREFSDRTTLEGFFEKMEDVAEAVKKIVEQDTETLGKFKSDILLRYHSDTKNSIFGSRGHTTLDGSYLQRPLNESEMETLVREVDSRLRPILYSD